MIPTTEAERIILEHFPLLHREECPLAEAQGRVLRADIRADRDLPPCDRVALDGYAVRAAELAAGVAEFSVGAVQAAGAPPCALDAAPGACVEVMTGAMLPDGADCVVPYEATDPGAPAGRMRVRAAPGEPVPGPGHGIHGRGSDRPAGAVLVRAGVRLGGPALAAAAACGLPSVTVSRIPSIAILSTGDELVGVGEPAQPWQVRRSNDLGLRASLLGAGHTAVDCLHVRDDPAAIREALARLLATHDVLFISGGVSRGKFDHIPDLLGREGVRRLFHGVAQRPGKPFWFGISPRMVPVFALPGNPVSAFTCLHRYGLPALAVASGVAPGSPGAGSGPPGSLPRVARVRRPHGLAPARPLPARAPRPVGSRPAHRLALGGGFVGRPRGPCRIGGVRRAAGGRRGIPGRIHRRLPPLGLRGRPAPPPHPPAPPAPPPPPPPRAFATRPRVD